MHCKNSSKTFYIKDINNTMIFLKPTLVKYRNLKNSDFIKTVKNYHKNQDQLFWFAC